ncbi:hypothetical protein IMSAG049_01481 [Clostridiales bacterium]|nr:hypothetical protein IMSAG049_01481 [Clostridiales bacterium]
MERLVKSIKCALDNQNYYSALFIALALPDICGKIEFGNGNKYRYKKWCDEYFVNREFEVYGTKISPYTIISSDDLFALRCSMLHEGSTEVKENIERFLFSVSKKNYIHCNKINNKLNLDIDQFCNDMCDCVSDWLNTHPTKLPIDIQIEVSHLPF